MLRVDRPGPASAAEFHGRAVDQSDDVRLWWCEPSRPALVLGSTQSVDLVRMDRCRERGIDIVERRSGGGAVFVSSHHTLWADVILPASHRAWSVDVGRASEWVGERWLEAMQECDIVDHFTLHRGAMVASEWSRLVCFAGRGPGEIFDSVGRKVLGVSQRRTRDWARFQCAVSLHWEPEAFVDVFRDDALTAEAVADDGYTFDRPVDTERLAAALATVLSAV